STAGYTGADLKELVTGASSAALLRVLDRDARDANDPRVAKQAAARRASALRAAEAKVTKMTTSSAQYIRKSYDEFNRRQALSFTYEEYVHWLVEDLPSWVPWFKEKHRVDVDLKKIRFGIVMPRRRGEPYSLGVDFGGGETSSTEIKTKPASEIPGIP